MSHVICHVSRVTCHASRVTRHMSRVTCHGPRPSADLRYSCAYIPCTLLLVVHVCLVNGFLNRCGSHISPLLCFEKTHTHTHGGAVCV